VEVEYDPQEVIERLRAAALSDHPRPSIDEEDVANLLDYVDALQAELAAERGRADRAERVLHIMADKDLGLFMLAHTIAAVNPTGQAGDE
jgi:hypothetical protein